MTKFNSAYGEFWINDNNFSYDANPKKVNVATDKKTNSSLLWLLAAGAIYYYTK